MLLRNHNFRLFFFSSMVSSLGDWIGLFALITLVSSMSDVRAACSPCSACRAS